jgi:hypothetical protein
MLPGRYVQFYQNVGQTIRDVEAAGEDKSAVASALDKLFVKPQEIITTTKCIVLARQSAKEGRTLAWN